MATGTDINFDTPAVTPQWVATQKQVGVDAVENLARRLGITFSRDPTGKRRLMSLRNAQKISKHFDNR